MASWIPAKTVATTKRLSIGESKQCLIMMEQVLFAMAGAEGDWELAEGLGIPRGVDLAEE
jgi:hypothetical protein